MYRYFVFNALQETIPMAPQGKVALKLLRNALCGFGATCVSDVVRNLSPSISSRSPWPPALGRVALPHPRPTIARPPTIVRPRRARLQVSNVIRVLKTTVQTAEVSISYQEAAKRVIEKEGIIGLFTRGLGTRLLTNGIQASLFSVVWKVFEEQFAKKGL